MTNLLHNPLKQTWSLLLTNWPNSRYIAFNYAVMSVIIQSQPPRWMEFTQILSTSSFLPPGENQICTSVGLTTESLSSQLIWWLCLSFFTRDWRSLTLHNSISSSCTWLCSSNVFFSFSSSPQCLGRECKHRQKQQPYDHNSTFPSGRFHQPTKCFVSFACWEVIEISVVI